MKKSYSGYLQTKFKDIIPKEFPCFQYLIKQREYGLDYNFICKDNYSFKMISIQNSHDENAFMVEIFWSIDGSKFQNDITHFSLENDQNILETICNTNEKSLRFRLPIFYNKEFESWWAIDPTGKIIKSINDCGFISSDVYFKFYSEDTFISDEKELTEDEIEVYIDPLIENAIVMIKTYAIPLFTCLDNKQKEL